MIEANELRIGNIVWGINKVTNVLNGSMIISAKHIYDLENGKSDFDFYGLEINGERLLKFEFIKEYTKGGESHSNFYSMYLYDYKYSFAYAKFREDWGLYHSYTDALLESDNNKYDFICGGIKYVHQLQNLYFALTQTELIIK